MTLSRLLLFLSVFSAIVLSIHYYVWTRLVRNADWPEPWGKVLTIAIFALAALVPLVFLTMRSSPRAFSIPLSWVVYTWLGFLFYLFMFSILGDVVRVMMSLAGALPREPERRRFMSQAIAAGVCAAAGMTGIWGLLNVAGGFKVKCLRIPLAKLPESASGYSIVQITDVHAGPTIGRKFVESVVRETNALEPDLIVITGDLVDGTVEHLREIVEPLRDLKARDGVFFVTGNHEYYSGADEWITHLQTLGIRVLRNERVDVRGLFDLAGVDDANAKGLLPHHGQDVERAVEGRDASRALVLLAHQPKTLKHAVKAGVDLQLSGHVHGGQMAPFNWLTHIDQPFVSGLHQVGKTWIYVSAGTGYWGPPMRVGTRSEITRIELV
jgi:predicted MPP superfamily phosphohydrolase